MIFFKRRYAIAALLLLVIEIYIAVYVHDTIVRPHIGDLLVVILIYCTAKAFVNKPVLPVAAAVLLFAYLVETLQYFNIVDKLGLKDSRLANIVIGNSFGWEDLLAYTVGIAIVLIIEQFVFKTVLRF